ncbi:membrane protein insertion efficiency factor YidD [Actinoplanes sp. NPDC051859]|uniref:membrane protein insertion efficiency factor YidD n=1 Tax=Actinoplanes sp. NPDC051859 TaxID=3363909 RepID=UPI0037B52DF9
MWGAKRRRKRRKKNSGDCGDCDCDVCDIPGCDFGLLSTSMLAFARLGGGRRGPGSGTDRAVTAAIRGYRKVSPRLPTRCRFTPSCSAYGLEAVQRYGTRRGLRLTAARLRRCRPGVTFGTADPVP